MIGVLAGLAAAAAVKPFDFVGVVEKVQVDSAMIVRQQVQHKQQPVNVRLAWIAPTESGIEQLRRLAEGKKVAGRCVDLAPNAHPSRTRQVLCDLTVANSSDSLSRQLIAAGNAYLVAESKPYNPHREFLETCSALSMEVRRARLEHVGAWAKEQAYPVVQQVFDPAVGLISSFVSQPPAAIEWESYVDQQVETLRSTLRRSVMDFKALVHPPPDNPCKEANVVGTDSTHAEVETVRGFEQFTGKEAARWMLGPPPGQEFSGDVGPFSRLK